MSIWLLAAMGLGALATAGFAYERLSQHRDRKRFPAPGRLIDVGGRRLHLLCRGDAPGPTVVIEQGIGGPSVVWQSVQAEIAKFARVCTYDRAGYLWSDAAAGPRTLDDRVADLHAALSSGATPPPYVLVGHSLGGLLVRRFALAYPRLVTGLVLVDAPDENVIFQELLTPFYKQGIRFQRVLGVLGRFGVVRLFGRRVPMLMLPDDELGYALCVTPQHAAAVADDMRAVLNAAPDVRRPQAAGALADRPLILLTHGVPFPPMAASMEEGWANSQRRLLALSSHSELITAAKSGHLIHIDEPALVIDAVRRVFIATGGG